MPVFVPGARVSCWGHAAVVVHGNGPDGWSVDGKPAEIVNIRFVPPVRGISPQIDIQAASLLPR